jgi:hypothetical protein
MDKTEEEQFRRKLALWLDEREVDLVLRENHETDSETQESGESTIVSFDPELTLPKNTEIGHDDLQKGDILLLSSELSPQEETDPLFVAVLRHWEDDYWLFAPYSSYSHPATDKEMRTDSEESRLRVLALWNCHTTSEENLKNSWYIGKLSESERKDALSVFWYSLGKKELTSELEEKVGPKLFHSKDPRRKYIEEELSKVSVIRERSNEPQATGTDGKKVIQFPPINNTEHTGEKIAAGTKDETPSYLELLCKELPIRLEIQYNPERDEKVYFELYTDSEELTKSLDLFSVKIIDDDNTIAPFINGLTSYKMSLSSFKFKLIDPNGTTLTLIEPSKN